MGKKGFTALECLGVISVIAIMAATFLPELARVKQRAEELQKKKLQTTEQVVERPEATHILQRDYWGNVKFEKATIDGHDYIVTAVGIVHNENCACRKK